MSFLNSLMTAVTHKEYLYHLFCWQYNEKCWLQWVWSYTKLVLKAGVLELGRMHHYQKPKVSIHDTFSAT